MPPVPKWLMVPRYVCIPPDIICNVAYRQAKPAFPFRSLKDHEEIVLGDHVVLEVLHTPGHTLESVSYLVKVDGKHISVLTGDCLFGTTLSLSLSFPFRLLIYVVGDVGRPDLLGALGITTDELARVRTSTTSTCLQPVLIT